MGRGRKALKLAGGVAGAFADKSELFVSDPQLEDPNQLGIGGREAPDPSVYFAVCRRDWFPRNSYYRLYKVDVAPSDPSSPGAPAAGRETLRRVGRLKTDVCGKTVVSLLSRWIVAVGGNPGGTVIFDTKRQKVIRGPKIGSPKQKPVVATVGYKVYALSARPNFLEEPDFQPWFEVLDLSHATVTERADGSLRLDGCNWEELPNPPCFPSVLTPTEYLSPPIIIVRSYVVVRHYILVSLNQPNSGTYAFDTNTNKWHKIEDKYLPFVGSATPLGRSGCIFLALSREDGPINAYRILVSTLSSSNSFSNVAGVSDKGDSLKLSITEFALKDKTLEEVGAGAGHYFASVDGGCFSLLTFSSDTRDCNLRYDDKACEHYPMQLHVKLATYQLEETPEIAVSSRGEQTFKVSSIHGFSSPPIAFALSI